MGMALTKALYSEGWKEIECHSIEVERLQERLEIHPQLDVYQWEKNKKKCRGSMSPGSLDLQYWRGMLQ